MATGSQTRPRFQLPRLPLPAIIAGLLVVAAILAFVITRATDTSGNTTGQAVPVTRGDLVDGISATGRLEPRISADLVFSNPQGRVAEVLVEEGATVAAGAPLVRLDSRQANAEVAAAEAALAQANADLQALNDGATTEQIAAARAQVAAAQGALQQVQGSVTGRDLAAARAQVEEARARLAALTGRPNADSLARADAAVRQAQAALDQQRSTLSAAKEQARQQIDTAANTLRNAQADYAAARDNLARVEADGDDPLTGAPLTDAGEQSYRDAFSKAERALQNAEAGVAQAQVAYEDARQRELSGIADAEARLRTAQADLAALRTPNPDTLASARAQLAAAEANLARLTGDERAGGLATQQANLEAAQANLNQLLADPRSSDLARAQARVAQAQANLDLARIRLEELTLAAPFAGVVARLNVAPGEDVTQQAPVTLVDLQRLQVSVTVDEVDIARVKVGQAVQVLIDALGQPALSGSVRSIAPLAEANNDVTAYEVVIEINPGERNVRPGMTASAMIVANQLTNVLSVPASAVTTVNGASVVNVVTVGPDGKQQVVERSVQIGSTIGDRIVITSGLNEGEQVQVATEGAAS